MISSPDGAYTAETSSDGALTTIRRVSDWTVVATLPARAVQFSGDGSRILTASQVPGQTNVTRFSDVDWATGDTVWTEDDPGDLSMFAVAEPGGQAFAVAIQSGPASDPATFKLVIVGAAGAAIDLGRFRTAF